MNNVLIIGSEGFIGSHLALFFKAKGFNTYCCDIHKKDNINNDKFFLVNSKNPDYISIFNYMKPELIINASGSASVQFSIENPLDDFKLNVLNVIKLLDAIKIYSIKCKFINLSSAAVYGNPERLPIKENYKISPKSPYGYHKYMSELICKEYYNMYNIKTCNLRIFSAYGPGLKKQLFWDIYNKYKTSKDNTITLFGTGKESRDFIYIYDLANAVYLISTNSHFKEETINVANEIEISINKAAKTFLKYLNPNVNILFNNEIREGDPTNWCANIEKLKSFNYKPRYLLNVGLKKYVEWLESDNFD